MLDKQAVLGLCFSGPLAGYMEFVFIRTEEIDLRTGSDLLGWGQLWGGHWIPTASLGVIIHTESHQSTLWNIGADVKSLSAQLTFIFLVLAKCF